MSDARWNDARDRDSERRDEKVEWVTLGRGSSEKKREDRVEAARDRTKESRERDDDPRDPFIGGLELPREPERELVADRNDTYELDGNDTRSLATIGAFRGVAERDLVDPHGEAHHRRDNLNRLGDEGLVRFVSLDGNGRALTLTARGRHLLESHRRTRDDRHRPQRFYAGVSRARELFHDARLYGAYRDIEARLRSKGASVRRVVLEVDLKRDYQRWLQEHNRGRADSDGRPDRS